MILQASIENALTVNRIWLGIISISLGLNGYFLKQVYDKMNAEIDSLRKDRHKHANILTEHAFRIKHVEEKLDIPPLDIREEQS